MANDKAMVANEVAAHCFKYEVVYFGKVDAVLCRNHWDGGSCTEENWMEIVADLFSIAKLSNSAVILFSVGDNNSLLLHDQILKLSLLIYIEVDILFDWTWHPISLYLLYVSGGIILEKKVFMVRIIL